MDLISRLKQYLDLRQISVTQFADVCGIPRPTASQLLAGRNKKVSDEIIGKIHQYYPELSIIWMMFGEGDMLVGNKSTETQQIPSVDSEKAIPYSPSLSDDTEKPKFEYANNEDVYEIANSNEDSAAKSEFCFTNEDSFKTQMGAEDAKPNTDPHTFEFSDVNNSNEHVDTKTDAESALFSLNTGGGKRVTGIVVYYDDQTYESFVPDPEHRHPFMRR